MNQLGPHSHTIEEGLVREYERLEAHQLAMYYGIEEKWAQQLKAGTLHELNPALFYKFVFAQGGFRSGKTHADIVGVGTSSIQWSDYNTLIARKRKEALFSTYLKEFKEFLERVSAGNLPWLLLDEHEDDGAVELLIRSVGKPSSVLFRCEPDGTEQFVKGYWKGRELARFTCEEASDLKWRATIDTLCTRLSRTDVPSRGTLLTNPTYEGTDIDLKFSQYQKELLNGERPFMLPILTRTEQIEKWLPPTYIADIKEQFKDDPVGLEMALYGTTGVANQGKPVFAGFFNKDRHVRSAIRFDPELPLIRGWDFGHDEAHCGFWQRTKSGRLEKIAELVSQNQFAEAFADDVGSYTKYHFQFIPKGILDYGDHAGTQNKDTGVTINVINKRLGIHIITAPFGNIDPGLDHMRKLLSETRDNGVPRLSYHPRCQKTIRAMQFGYFYKKLSDGRLMPKPFPNEYEHGIDADRYVCCHEIPIAREQSEWKNIKAKGVVDIRRARVEKAYEDWLKTPPAPPTGTGDI